MHRRGFRVAALILAAIMVTVLAVTPAFAQGGGNAGNWQTLQSGQSVEWIFNYLGDGPATIRMSASSSNSVGFNVFTDQQWMTASTDTPIGRGTQRVTDEGTGADRVTTLQDNGDLEWTINNQPAGIYHVQVYTTGSQDAGYMLQQTGSAAGGLARYAQGGSTPNNAATGTLAAATKNGAPLTLPITGGAESAWLISGAGSLLVAAGWLARRRRAS